MDKCFSIISKKEKQQSVYWFVFFELFCLAGIIFFSLYYFYANSLIDSVMTIAGICLCISAIIFYPLINSDYDTKMCCFLSDGLVTRTRKALKPKYLLWDDIKCIYVFLSKKDSNIKRISIDGLMLIENGPNSKSEVLKLLYKDKYPTKIIISGDIDDIDALLFELKNRAKSEIKTIYL